MDLSGNRIILYCSLIVVIGIDFALPWPISTLKDLSNVQQFQNPLLTAERRFSRQVVQPKWLNFGRDPFIDPTVHVNPQALLEAEKIRETIQRAVNEGTYVVTAEQQVQNNAMEAFLITTPSVETNTPLPTHGLPNWYVQLRKLWHNWGQNLFKGFRN